MSEIVKMSDQFGGLPLDQLIGGPLAAACDAQMSLAKATSDFIETVGFEDGKVRYFNFKFDKYEQEDQEDGSLKNVKREYDLQIPFISIVSVPTLQVTEVDVNFMMEVKSSFSEKTKEDRQASFEAELQGKVGPFKVKAKVQGSIATSKETQRQSDNSAKYDIAIKARQSGTPEGLSRVLDILQQSIAPVPTGLAADVAEEEEAA
ncbi:DUF2589 domain-containing protein [Marinomonas sp. PE14-40]|uniref:DUF2589 domain-containing protein n=1 Tax=Marinomonas sp. PE14-40 TaxID=3060621 RepID=UPI003F6718BE